MNYLVAAYIISWIVVGGYVLLLGMRLRTLEEDLRTLEPTGNESP